jgi:hypothetical protein
MHECQNYGWLTVDNHKSKKYYYLTDSLDALEIGYFQLEDTGEVFKVTGINHNVMPMCLDFEKNTDEIVCGACGSACMAPIGVTNCDSPIAFDEIPTAKIVPESVLNDRR